MYFKICTPFFFLIFLGVRIKSRLFLALNWVGSRSRVQNGGSFSQVKGQNIRLLNSWKIESGRLGKINQISVKNLLVSIRTLNIIFSLGRVTTEHYDVRGSRITL